jgi:hypothetical protein
MPNMLRDGTSTEVSYTNIADGAWYFHIRAQDLTGNWGLAKHYKIKIDINGPRPTNALVTIDDGLKFSNDYVLDLEWSNFEDINGSGIAGYYYSFTNNGGTSDGAWTTNSKGTLTATSEGQKTVYVWAEDNVGYVGNAKSATITIKLPTVVDLKASSGSVYRAQTITFISNGTDVIDPEKKLTSQFQFKHADSTWQELPPIYVTTNDGFWQTEFTPALDAELGTYEIRIRYTNLNGVSTAWTTMQFTVLNNPPQVVNPINDFNIQEDQSDSTTVNLNEVFSDVEKSNLDFSINGNDHIKVTINPDGTVIFTPEPNWTGTETITFSASDRLATPTKEDVQITITPVNDIPIAIIDTKIRTCVLGKGLIFEGHGMDIDGTITKYKWLSDLDGEIGTNSSFEASILSHGQHTISFMVKDNEGAWSETVTTQLKITAPDLIIDKIELSTEDITEGDSIKITAIVNNHGDANATDFVVEFFDGDKKLGSKKLKQIEPGASEEVTIDWQPDIGDHTLQVVIKTDDEEIIESDNDNNQLTKTITVKMDWTPYIILLIVIVIILIVIIFFILRSRKLKQKDKKAIAEIESQLEQARKLGVPTGELEKLLEEAKGLRKRKE